MSARVCLLTNEYPPDVGGVGTSAQRIANALAASGTEMHVLHLDKASESRPLDQALETRREGSVLVHRAQIHYPDWRDPSARSSEAEVLTRYNRDMFEIADSLQRKHRFDALHGFFLYPGGYVASLVAGIHGLPSLVSIRGNDVGKYMFDPLRMGFVATALRGADLVTSVASSLLSAAETGLAPLAGKSRVILNSIDTSLPVAPAPTDLRLAAPVVGSAGLFRYKKGLRYLFQALSELAATRKFSLLLAGDFFDAGEAERHRAEIDALGLSERTLVTGRLTQAAMRGHLSLFDVVVFPSLFAEGCPNSLLEAMTMGRAIVASRSGAIPELLKHEEQALLVSPGSTAELSQALCRLLDDAPLRASLGTAARRRAEQLSPEIEREAWRQVYADLLS